MTERPWRIDPGVARDLGEALGWSGDDGVAALARRFPAAVPCGSTAKLAAMAADEVPPGADVDDLARRLLDHQQARVGRTAGGLPVPSPAWSCWVLATVMAAVVDGSGLGPVRVAATRRIDDRAPVVDLHAAVVVDAPDATWVADPYFGAAVRAPAPGAPAATDQDPLASATLAVTPAGGWALEVLLKRWASPLRYRLLAADLDRDDVRAMCAISVSHSGVAARPYARLHVDGGVVDARVTEEGVALVERWDPPESATTARPDATAVGVVSSTEHADWPAAVADLAARTGVTIV